MRFSIVIAVRNEVEHIKKCIASVFNQDYKGEYDVTVVDGISSDGTYELLKKIQKEYKFKLLKNPKINAAAGRNIGIENSKGLYVAFIDGDAIASKDWLSQIKKVFEKNDVAGVGGPDMLPEDSSDKARRIGQIMTSPLARGGRLNPSTQHSLSDEEKYVDHIPTCNLCLKREIFSKVGMFDEGFVKGQDLELNYRIVNSGYKLLYSPKIKVVHHRKNHIRDFTRQIYKWAKAKVAIIKKHGLHGLASHIYLWPVYFLIGFLMSIIIFFLFNIMKLYVFLFLIAIIFYITVILFESGQLSRKYNDKKLFFYATFLLPIVHLSYSFGIIVALIKRNIW